MLDEDGFNMRKSTRVAAAEASKKIRKNAEDNADHDPFFEDEVVTQSDVDQTSDDKSQRRKDRKQKTKNQVLHFAEPQLTLDSSKNNLECSNSCNSDMPKNRRWCSTKSYSEKCASRRGKNTKYKDATCEEEEDEYDVNERRESYNSFLLNKEPNFLMPFPGSKQLVVRDGVVSYKESLMNFTKGLGKTAEKVASQMIQRRGPTHQARHQLEGLLPSQNALGNPHFLDLNTINNSLKNTSTNQMSQPAISIGDPYANSIASKGKSRMVDDGKSDRDKLSVADSLELLFGKRKGDIKIGNGSLENKDLGFNSDVSTFSWVPQPPMHSPTTVPQPKNWCPSPYATTTISPHFEFPLALTLNKNIMDKESNVWSKNLWAPSQTHQYLQAHSHGQAQFQQEQLLNPNPPTFGSEMAMSAAIPKPFGSQQDSGFPKGNHLQHEPQNPPPSQTQQFLQGHLHGPAHKQPQHQLLNPRPPTFWTEIVFPASKPELNSLSFGTQQDSWFPKGNHSQHPPNAF